MELYHADVLVPRRYLLAEGPVWDKAHNALLYEDIMGNTIHTLDLSTGQISTRTYTQNVGCFALRKNGGLILGLAAGVYLQDESGRQMTKFPGLDFDPLVRANDGKCDPKGRFWFGTVDQVEGNHLGELYCMPGDGRCIKMLDGIQISNGLVFDGNLVYYIDTPTGKVMRYTLDEEAMVLRDGQVAIEVDPAHGTPDGMTQDENGMLWVAHWGGGFVGRYNPANGELLAKVMIPASQCSSCCFGGEDMQTLFITSASTGRDEESEAGQIFSIHLPYRGVESPMFIG